MKTTIITLAVCLLLFVGAQQYYKPHRIKSVIVIADKLQDTLDKYNKRGWQLSQMEPFIYYTDGRTAGGPMEYANDYFLMVDSYNLVFEK